MQTYGVDAVVRILSHFVFIYVSFWALQSVRIDQFFKKNMVRQMRMLLVIFAIAIGYLCSTWFLELIALFRNLLQGLPF